MSDACGMGAPQPGGPFSSMVSSQHSAYKKALKKFKQKCYIKMFFNAAHKDGKSEMVGEDVIISGHEKQSKEIWKILQKGIKEGYSKKLFTKLIEMSNKPFHNTNGLAYVMNKWENFNLEEAEDIIRNIKPIDKQDEGWKNDLLEIIGMGIKETEKKNKEIAKNAHKLPPNKLKLIEALQLIRFKYTNYKHDPMPEVKILDTEYPGQPHQKTYNERADLLGWNLHHFSNPKKAAKTIDDIDSFARLLTTSKKQKYERVKALFPEQSKFLRRYIRDHVKGLRIKGEDGLWHQTTPEEIKRIDNNSL
jgi:hypothetical protein